jgi:hypothetical protein
MAARLRLGKGEKRMGDHGCNARARGRAVTTFVALWQVLRTVVLAACAFAVLVGLGGSASASSADKPREKTIHGHFVYVDTSSGENCSWGIGIEFATVPDAASYTVSYFDGYNKAVETSTVTPSQLRASDASVVGLGSDEAFFGVTGGSSSPPCQAASGDPTEGGRFSKGATVVANLGYKVSGEVILACGAACGAHKTRLADVRIDLSGRISATTTITDVDGQYEAVVDRPGSYTISAASPGLHFKPAKRKVTVANAGVSGENFRGCSAGAAATPAALASAADAVRGGTYELNDCANSVTVAYRGSAGALTLTWAGIVKCPGAGVDGRKRIVPIPNGGLVAVTPQQGSQSPNAHAFHDQNGNIQFFFPLDANGDQIAGVLHPGGGGTVHGTYTSTESGCQADIPRGSVLKHR